MLLICAIAPAQRHIPFAGGEKADFQIAAIGVK
jgi:hypothetical protein